MMNSGSGKPQGNDRELSQVTSSEGIGNDHGETLREVRVCSKLNRSLIPLVINAALFLSHSLRRDTILRLMLKDGLVIEIDPRVAKRLYPDTESLLGVVRAIERGRAFRGIKVFGECPPQLFEFTLKCPLNVIKVPVTIDPSKLTCLTKKYSLDQVIVISHILIDREMEGKKTVIVM